jgi:hypothetical protein
MEIGKDFDFEKNLALFNKKVVRLRFRTGHRRRLTKLISRVNSTPSMMRSRRVTSLMSFASSTVISVLTRRRRRRFPPPRSPSTKTTRTCLCLCRRNFAQSTPARSLLRENTSPTLDLLFPQLAWNCGNALSRSWRAEA